MLSDMCSHWACVGGRPIERQHLTWYERSLVAFSILKWDGLWRAGAGVLWAYSSCCTGRSPLTAVVVDAAGRLVRERAGFWAALFPFDGGTSHGVGKFAAEQAEGGVISGRLSCGFGRQVEPAFQSRIRLLERQSTSWRCLIPSERW